MDFKQQLQENGYVVIPNILSHDKVEHALRLFHNWKSTIENFSHLASNARPAFIDQIEPSHINGSGTFTIKLGRLGGKFNHLGNVNPTIAGLVEDSTSSSTDGTGQSFYIAYAIGLNKDSKGPALKVHYNFSPS